jgi:hypothetical protein
VCVCVCVCVCRAVCVCVFVCVYVGQCAGEYHLRPRFSLYSLWGDTGREYCKQRQGLGSY